MKKYVTFGEIMLRLKSPGFERFFQSPQLEATFGGGEANVAVGLARLGLNVFFVTAIPKNPIGDACVAELRRYGVHTDHIVRQGSRLGIYFLEQGANQRPSNIIYDRVYSSISQAKPGDINWEEVFKGTTWFHISGITPAISTTAAELSLDAVKTAHKMGVIISCDLNYRKKLWQYGKKPVQVMGEIARYVDVALGNEEDFQKSLEIKLDVDVESAKLEIDKYEQMTARVFTLYPNMKKIAVTLRESYSADYNSWSAVLNDGKEFLVSTKYEIRDIVDRVGAGDSFAAGIIYGLENLQSDQDALEYATAASCLMHSIPGDLPLFTHEEILRITQGNVSGRVQR